ncbi:hypothetical protein A8H39_00535 [Paraburkholderia fungorum]|uniref:hypothetical protein n=1 Tax=Paraburkholderia fungorum TaxID=134537 RepID=UPI0004838B09|nr:hypothetical protein [Paraburkholderia fungorum]PNE59671.1 hypothetical protein A8H39_00535 [Paraburkholderia fungorum]
MTQSANSRVTDPSLGILNVLPVGVLVVFKVLKLMFRALRGVLRSLDTDKGMEAKQPQEEATVVRKEAAPSKLKEAVDEPSARVVRRSTSEKSSGDTAGEKSKPSIWEKKPAMRIADRHAVVDIASKQYRFSVYLAANEIQRIEIGRVRKPLAAFTRSTAANEKVAFTLEEAVEYTRRELAAARRRGPSRKTEAQPPAQPAHPDQYTAPKQKQPSPAPAAGSSMDEDVPHWVDIPCFDEMDAQAPSRGPAPEAARGPEPARAAAPRPQQPIRRDPPPPPADARPSGENGVEEGQVDFRGARRVVGKVIGLGVIEVKKPKKDPFSIYAITLRTPDGEEEQFRGYELEQHVDNNRVAIGDTISLKRGRQQFWVIRNGVRNEKTRNIYDFQVMDRARR